MPFFEKKSHSSLLWLLSVKLVVLIIVGVLGFIALSATSQLMHQREVQTMEKTVERSLAQLKTQKSTYIQAMYGARAFMSSTEDELPSHRAWHRFQENSELARRLPGIGVMHYLSVVEPQEATSLIAEVRRDTSVHQEGYPYFTITPALPKTTGYVATHVYPASLETAASSSFGFDYGSEPTRRQVIEKARDSGRGVMSDAILTRTTNERVFLIFVPAYKNGLQVKTVEERREAFVGGILLGFRNQEFFDRVFSDLMEKENITTEVYDGAEVAEDALIYRSGGTVLGAQDPNQAYVDEVNDLTVVTRQIELSGKTWTVKFTKTHPYTNLLDMFNPVLVLAGLIVMIPLFVYAAYHLVQLFLCTQLQIKK